MTPHHPTTALRPVAVALASLFPILALPLLSTEAAAQAPEQRKLDPIVVTATRVEQRVSEAVADVSVITEEEIRASRATDLVDLLRTLPGVQFSSNGGVGKATSVFLRGANANHTLLLIDGVRVGSATLGTASFQDLPLDQIERIEVLRGPASSLYGADAIGGVIQVFTKQGGAPKAELTAGVGTQSTRQFGASLRGQNGGTRFALGVAHRKTDGFDAIANPANFNANPDRDGYRNNSVSAQLSQEISDGHRVGANLLVARARNQYDSSFPTPLFDYRTESETASYGLWSSDRWMPGWVSHLRAGRTIDDGRNFGPASATNLNSVESRFKTRQTQYTWQNDLTQGPGVLTLGAERLEQKVDSTTRYDVSERQINSIFAGYTGHAEGWGWQANVRRDRNSQYGTRTTGFGGLSYAFAPDWRLGATAGTGFRAPTFNELYFPNFGNPLLRPERSRNAELFVRYETEQVRAGITGWRNRVTDLVAFAGPNFEPVNVAKAKLQGVSLTLDANGGPLRFGANIDFQRPKDEATGKLLARRSKRAGTVYVGYREAEWDARIEVTGQDERFDDAANQKRLGGYGIVNLSAGYKLNPEWTLGLRVDNAFQKTYEQVRDYSVPRRAAMFTVAYQPKL